MTFIKLKIIAGKGILDVFTLIVFLLNSLKTNNYQEGGLL